MKKPIAWCIAALLLLALTACSAPEIPMITHENEAPAESETPSETSMPEPVKTFSRGIWSGKTFTSDYAGVTFTLPNEGWKIYTDAELAEYMDISLDESGFSLTEQDMLQQLNIIDMMAENPETGSYIMLMYENLALNPTAQGLTLEEYAQILTESMSYDEEFSITVDDPTATTLCGREYLVLHAYVDELGLHQTYLIRAEGGMMVDLVLVGVGEESIESLLKLFEK